MSETKIIEEIEKLQDKLDKELTKLAALKQKAKHLKIVLDDSRLRESRTREMILEMLDRQGELHIILDRANVMLHRSQEAMSATTLQFNQMLRELPESKRSEWVERLGRLREALLESGVPSLSAGAKEWDFNVPSTRTCPKCGKQTTMRTSICPSCYASLETDDAFEDSPLPLSSSRSIIRFRKK